MKCKSLLILPLLVVSLKSAIIKDYYFELNDTGSAIIKPTSYKFAYCDDSAVGEIVIPGTFSGLPVTSIGHGAFFYCRYLTSIIIPESVTSIGPGAFGLCDSLTNVTIPNSVTLIGDSSFEGCTSLNSITIPNSVSLIDYSAFRDRT
jgi:hypothetical protein